ncbi:MAG: 3-oxoacyl-ACP reductase FabG [Acidobacteriota bacterium]|nr:MAG: 3-oxoacyl-ACP reductase FabG [Acidobacteriota bacterium]
MSEGPIVLLSGGSRGLGLVLARHLLASGFRVATFSRKPSDALDSARAEHGEKLRVMVGDMADADSLRPIVSEVERDFGPIEALVNNAGIAHAGLLATMPPAEIERMIAINLTGALLLARLVVRKMIVRSRGSVINISSIIGQRGYSGLAAYSATKAGLDGMTRALARELGERQIRVNAIAPGYLETELTDELTETQREQIVRRTPLGRLGTAEDIAGTVLFLLSPASAFITGQTFVIDGGITC